MNDRSHALRGSDLRDALRHRDAERAALHSHAERGTINADVRTIKALKPRPRRFETPLS